MVNQTHAETCSKSVALNCMPLLQSKTAVIDPQMPFHTAVNDDVVIDRATEF